MKHLKEKYRQFEMDRILYEVAEGSVEIKAEKEKAPEKPAEEMALKGADPQEIWNTAIEPKYAPDIYETKARTDFEKIYQEVIKDSADKAMPEGAGVIDKEDLIRRSVENYGKVYKSVMIDFFDKGSKLYADREKAAKIIDKKTREELSNLRDVIEHGTEAHERQQKIDDITLKFKKWLDKQNELKYSSKHEVRRKFEAYVEAMNDHYLNPDWQKARLKPPKGRSRTEAYKYYKDLAKQFKKRMEKKVDANLKYTLSLEGTDKENLKTIQKQIEDEYKKYASLDKRPGMIDLEDLMMLEKVGSPSLDMLALMNTTGDNADKNILEAIHLMNPDAWEDAMERAEATIINDAITNRAEDQFIEAANRWRKEKEGKGTSFETFSGAEDYFEDTLKIYSKIGVEKTYAFIMHFNEVVNEHRIEILESVSPKFIKNLAYRERERLLSRRMVPDRKEDQIVVEFVSANREGRDKILEERGAELLKQIKNIQKHYKTASDNFKLNKKKISTNSRNRDKPTDYDKVARLQAMIMISKEAGWIIEKDPEKLKGILEDIEADKEPVYEGWKFKDTRRTRHVPYRSALHRGGFNGRDLAVTGLKVLGAMTTLANVANSIRAAEGDDFFEKVADGIGKSVTNPGVLAGAAVTFGAHTLQMNPEYYEYLRESKYGRLEIDSTRKLRSLSKRAGSSYVKKFVHNNSEWAAMDKLEVGQVKSLMKKVSKRRPPNISKKDLATFITDKEVMVGIPEDFNNAHLRYQFYRKFLSGREKPNISQLKTICQSNKIVS